MTEYMKSPMHCDWLKKNVEMMVMKTRSREREKEGNKREGRNN